MIEVYDDNYFMKQALIEAQKAFDEGEIPIGAVVVLNNQIIGRGHNQTERLNDFTAHAEMIAFTSATETLGNKYLRNATLYVTLEPCAMCGAASKWTQLTKVVYGASDLKNGATIYKPTIFHSKINIKKGVFEVEAQTLLDNFFQNKR